MTVSKIDAPLTFSLRRLASEFGMHRDTVVRRLEARRVKPAGMRDGFQVYALRDVAAALVDPVERNEDGNLDPAQMSPTDRRAHYQAESFRLEFESRRKRLILATDYDVELRRLAAILTSGVERLPTMLERDDRMPGEVLAYVAEQVRAMQAQIAHDLHDALVEPHE